MYEFMDGGRFNAEWRGRQIPVPPQEIRERLRFPAKHQFTCLHKDREDELHPEFRQAALTYLKSFEVAGSRGTGILLAGPRRVGASTAASSLANEIILRHVSRKDMTAVWLSCFYVLRMALDAKDFRHSEAYSKMRKDFMKSDILVVDDLAASVDIIGGKSFVESVYSYRDDHNLPTITTVTLPEAGTDLGDFLSKTIGKTFTDRLRENCRGYVVKL
jgi:DNA replication protein DnaC